MNAAKWMVAGLALLGGCTAERQVSLQPDGSIEVTDNLKLFPETMSFLREQAAGQDSVLPWLARIDQAPSKEELRGWRREGLDIIKWKVKSVVGGSSTIRTGMILESANVRTEQIEPRLMLDLNVEPHDDPSHLRIALGLPGMYLLRDVDLKSVVGLSQMSESSHVDFVVDVPGTVISTYPAAGMKNGPVVTVKPGKVTWRFTPLQLANQGSGAQVAVVFAVDGAPASAP